ncbi:MAG: DUF192 domain-containing protein [Candidatus Aenigmarchaeota archaeon]|nr:DUF192 domain-containing protein [Candidatus Aenigmarchaeota archaeon]
MALVQTADSASTEIIFIAVLAVIVFLSLRTRSYADVRVGNATVRAEIADNIVKQMLGLMGRGALADDAGMMFPLGQESRPKFWMMGMRIPIDVIYMDINKTVVDMKSDVQSFSLSNLDTTFVPGQKAMYVLEVPAGFVQKHAIKVGAKAEFTLG